MPQHQQHPDSNPAADPYDSAALPVDWQRGLRQNGVRTLSSSIRTRRGDSSGRCSRKGAANGEAELSGQIHTAATADARNHRSINRSRPVMTLGNYAAHSTDPSAPQSNNIPSLQTVPARAPRPSSAYARSCVSSSVITTRRGKRAAGVAGPRSEAEAAAPPSTSAAPAAVPVTAEPATAPSSSSRVPLTAPPRPAAAATAAVLAQNNHNGLQSNGLPSSSEPDTATAAADLGGGHADLVDSGLALPLPSWACGTSNPSSDSDSFVVFDDPDGSDSGCDKAPIAPSVARRGAGRPVARRGGRPDAKAAATATRSGGFRRSRPSSAGDQKATALLAGRIAAGIDAIFGPADVALGSAIGLRLKSQNINKSATTLPLQSTTAGSVHTTTATSAPSPPYGPGAAPSSLRTGSAPRFLRPGRATRDTVASTATATTASATAVHRDAAALRTGGGSPPFASARVRPERSAYDPPPSSTAHAKRAFVDSAGSGRLVPQSVVSPAQEGQQPPSRRTGARNVAGESGDDHLTRGVLGPRPATSGGRVGAAFAADPFGVAQPHVGATTPPVLKPGGPRHLRFLRPAAVHRTAFSSSREDSGL